ncbi:MAG TPA: MEDS domain-containing protein, partial [Nitrospirota bacterium]|nr:MEDS domain-containing protein [Nitrospirota bacterium]
MLSDKRKSGIPLVGELPWGSHFCQFYQTVEDLLDILLPDFAAGVESNEFCVWITSEAADDDVAGRALETAAHRLTLSPLQGKVEIIPSSRWHAVDGKTGSAFSLMLDRAITGGFDGLRIAYTASPAKVAGRAFAQEMDAIRRYNALALFAYRRDEFDALGLMDVIKNHRFALVRNAGGWEVIESSEARTVRDELAKSEEKLQSLFNNMSEGFAYHRIVLDPAGKPCDYIFLEVNKAFEKLTGLRGKDIVGKRVTAALPGIEKDPTDWIGIYGNVALTGVSVQFESYAGPLGKWYLVSAFCSHKGYFGVTFSDITARKQAEEKIATLNEELKRKIAELSAANVSMSESRRAALNLVEDAVAARRDTEKANTDLKRSVERFELLAATAGELLQAADP